ncbi:hypothetical protein HYZ97_04515 [Candidatus Pacearchaeota archaeon]|nr:hypothetical protein [Candidatus Pacearchaeota archaeon]
MNMKGKRPYETVGSDEEEIVLEYLSIFDGHRAQQAHSLSSPHLQWDGTTDSSQVTQAYSDFQKAFLAFVKAIPHQETRERVAARLELKVRILLD